MFFLDDILLSPFTSLMWICRELKKAVDQENVNVKDKLSDELSRLYMLLETGQINEADFETRETEILDELDRLAGLSEDEQNAVEDADETTDETTDELTDEPIDESTDELTDEPTAKPSPEG